MNDTDSQASFSWIVSFNGQVVAAFKYETHADLFADGMASKLVTTKVEKATVTRQESTT